MESFGARVCSACWLIVRCSLEKILRVISRVATWLVFLALAATREVLYGTTEIEDLSLGKAAIDADASGLVQCCGTAERNRNCC